jgi:glycosyltransferase involved in cell wall biosynthesis
MKVLHLLSQIPEATGSGIYLQAIMRQAALRGYQNYLLAGVPADFPVHDRLQPLDYLGSSFVRFGQDLAMPVIGMSDVMPYPSARFCDLSEGELALYENSFAEKLGDAVACWQPDLIHSHHLWLLTSLARRQFPDIPLLTSCHGSDLRQFENCTHLQATVLAGCKRVDAVCALSREQKQTIHQLYGIPAERIHVVGGGYDERRFYPDPDKQTRPPVEILYAGKLAHSKGVPWLLRALENLPANGFVVHLVGDGSGSERDEILALARHLGKKVVVHGNLNQQRLAEMMRRADLFVLPSFFEGLPLVLLEALASGCRIIATDLPGIRELFDQIDSDWVELVPLPKMASIDTPHPEAEDRFVTTLQQTVQVQLQRIIAGAATTPPQALLDLLHHYTWHGVFSKIEQLYQQLALRS